MTHLFNRKQRFGSRPLAAIAVSGLLVAVGVTLAYGKQQVAQKPNSTAQTSETPSSDTPILCITDTGGPNRESSPVWAIFPEVPRIADAEISRQHSIGKVKWSKDRKGIVATRAYGDPLAFYRYDSAKQRFGAPQNLAAVFANPGVQYEIRPVFDEFDWSSNGENLIYKDRQGLMLINLKTGQKRVVATHKDYPQGFRFLALSPNGKQVAFSTESNEGLDPLAPQEGVYENLWSMNIDGSQPRKLGHGMAPDWSSDSRYLLAIIGKYSGGNRLCRYEVASGKRQILISRSLKELDAAVYSPDGKHIAVFGVYDPKRTGEYGVFLTDAQGKFVKVVATYDQLSSNKTSPITHPASIEW